MDNSQYNDYLWYTRDKQGIKGPFTIGMMHRFILIGRLQLKSEVSRDKRDWLIVRNVSILIPEEMQHIRTDEDQERLLQAQLREDERSKDRRREKLGEFQGRRNKTDRRQPEGVISKAYRRTRSHVTNETLTDERNILPSLFIVSVIVCLLITGIYVYLESDQSAYKQADCTIPAKSGVNWSHCQMEGKALIGAMLERATIRNANLTGANLSSIKLAQADLSYANLSIVSLANADLKKAILKGVNLRGADLSNAIFRGADLSYADLRGAQIKGADFSGVILSKAIWVDGSQCKVGAVSVCTK